MRVRFGAGLLAGVVGLSPAIASAQVFGPLLGTEIPFEADRGKNVSVTERPRPELDQIGIRTGAFMIFPRASVGSGYSDNVFGADSGAVSDAYFTLRPNVTLQSNWSRHSFNLDANVQLKRFVKQTLKNETGYTVTATGRIDVDEGRTIDVIAAYQKGYEDFYSGTFPGNAGGSVPYRRTTGLVRGTWEINRVRLIANADINQFDFSSVKTRAGQTIDLRFRNRTEARGAARVEYGVSPNTAAFIEASYLASNYNNAQLPGGDRGSKEVRVLGGVSFDLTSLVRATVGLGYVHRAYDKTVYGAIQGLAVDAQVSYFVDTLTTLSLSGRRDVQDAVDTRSPGYISTRFQARADHELLRNLLPYVAADYEQRSFRSVTRLDHQFTIRGGATYLTNRFLEIDPEVSYGKRTSSGQPAGLVFDEIRASITVTAKL